ncbi:MAG: hypothetical protein WCR74_08220 [Betaproteobacteria bacterium]
MKIRRNISMLLTAAGLIASTCAFLQKMSARYLASHGQGVPFHIWTIKQPTSAKFDGWKLRATPNYTTFFQAPSSAG